MTKEEIYEKALSIIAEQDEHNKHIETCRRAMLCPKCGDQVQRTERYAGYFGFITDHSCKKCDNQ